MAKADLERFRAAQLRNLEAMNRRDLDTAFSWVPEGFEWYPLPELVPHIDVVTAALKGPEEIREFFDRIVAEWDWHASAREFRDPGDGTLVVRLEGHGVGRTTELEMQIHFRQIWEFEASDEDGSPARPVRVRETVEGTRLPGIALRDVDTDD